MLPLGETVVPQTGGIEAMGGLSKRGTTMMHVLGPVPWYLNLPHQQGPAAPLQHPGHSEGEHEEEVIPHSGGTCPSSSYCTVALSISSVGRQHREAGACKVWS